MSVVWPFRARGRAAAALVVGCVLVLGCSGDGGTGPPTSQLVVYVDGRVERSGVVDLRVETEGQALPHDAVTWTAEPADAVSFLGQGRARLLRAGSVSLNVAAAGSTGSVTLDVAVPPAIVFERLVDGRRDLWRSALDGMDASPLASHAAEDRSPTSGGGWVYFLSYRTGAAEVHRVPIGGGSTQLIALAGSGKGDPAISADGARLAYTRVAGGLPRLYTSTGTGTDARQVTEGAAYASAVEGSPSWSPDGARLVFMSTVAGNASLYLFIVATRAVEPIVVTSAPEVEPAWSPDGSRIVFASSRGGQTDLYLYTLATGATTQLTDHSDTDGQPAWLPDGRVIFTRWSGGAPRLRWVDPTAPQEIHVVETGEGTPGRASAIR